MPEAFNASGSLSMKAAFAAVESEMKIMREGLPSIDWPPESKKYADDLLEAVSTIEVQAGQLAVAPSESELASTTEALGRMRTSIALLRKSLGLPEPPKNRIGEPGF